MAEQTATAKAAPQEEIKTCPGCKKPLKRAKRYYRNGEYYHNKNCWKNATQKADTKDAPH